MKLHFQGVGSGAGTSKVAFITLRKGKRVQRKILNVKKNEVTEEGTTRKQFDNNENSQVDPKRKHFLNRPKRYKERARYYCDQCHYSTKGDERLRTHIQQVHQLCVVPLVNCNKCEFKTSSMRFLKVHMSNAHLGRADGNLVCEYCGFRCVQGERLTRHVALWHKEQSQRKKSVRNLHSGHKKSGKREFQVI